MEFIGSWIRNIILIILINNFISMLLPSSRLKDYVRVVMGVFMVLVLIQPVLQLLNLPEYRLTGEIERLLPSEILAAEGAMEEKNKELMLRSYGRTLVQQVESLVKVHPEVEAAQAQVYLDSSGELRGIKVNLYRENRDTDIRIEPIAIGQDNEVNDGGIAREIQLMLAGFYRLDVGAIHVVEM